MKPLTILMLVLLTAGTFVLAGCGSGGGGDDNSIIGGGDGPGGGQTNTDRDDDGIPNVDDAFPDDSTRFAAFTRIVLDSLDGFFSTGIAVNENDQVVGMADDGTAVKAVRWEVDASAGTAEAPVVLNPLDDNDYSAAYGNNDQGAAVGESEKGEDFVAVLWASGSSTPAELSLSGGFVEPSAAYSINNGDQIVGEANSGSGREAVLWNGEVADPVSLGTLGGDFSAAYFINDGGLIVGESEAPDGSTLAVVWMVDSNGQITDGPIALGNPGTNFVSGIAFGVDNFGRVVGEAETAGGEAHAVLWVLDPTTLMPSEIIDLGISGQNGSAYAVNDSGRMAGWADRSGASTASAWDFRNPSLIESILGGDGFSQAYGINEGDLTVGISDGQAFVAVPQQP